MKYVCDHPGNEHAESLDWSVMLRRTVVDVAVSLIGSDLCALRKIASMCF